MNCKNEKPKLILVGSYPPPTGGCSVHVQRLSKSVKRQFDVTVLDFYNNKNSSTVERMVFRCGSRPPMNLIRAAYQLKRQKPHLIHFHVSSLGRFVFVGRLLGICSGKETKKILTIHSGSFVVNFKQLGVIKRYLLKNLLNSLDHLIVVSDEQNKLLNKIGYSSSTISLIPAFIPPEVSVNEALQNDIHDLKRKEKIVFVSSGYAIPIYRYEVILDAIEQSAYSDKIGLILCFYNQPDQKYLSEIRTRVKANPNVLTLFNLDSGQFNFVLSQCEIYVRATELDGDCVAIREAIYHNKRVIASDCVHRPVECKLFSSGSVDSLRDAIDALLEDSSAVIEPNESINNADKIKNIYYRLLGQKKVYEPEKFAGFDGK